MKLASASSLLFPLMHAPLHQFTLILVNSCALFIGFFATVSHLNSQVTFSITETKQAHKPVLMQSIF